ncbi:MAG: porin family protein [Maribacter sp.]|uniref:porin family protein n=1 Tax=Maribacter sp. TaxID=1897614 RepID=UPI003299E78A
MKNLMRFTIVAIATTTLTSCCATKDLAETPFCKVFMSTAAGAISSNVSEGGDYGGTDNESKLGFQLGANALLPINQNLRLETGLGYASKGAKSSYASEDGEASFSQEDKLNLSYLEAPILVRYQFNNTGFNAYGGLQPALLLGAKQKSEATGSTSQNIDVKDRYKGLDTSAVFGIGYEFKNGFMLNAGYELGLMNIAESSEFGNATAKNRAFKISLGYIFGK